MWGSVGRGVGKCVGEWGKIRVCGGEVSGECSRGRKKVLGEVWENVLGSVREAVGYNVSTPSTASCISTASYSLCYRLLPPPAFQPPLIVYAINSLYCHLHFNRLL